MAPTAGRPTAWSAHYLGVNCLKVGVNSRVLVRFIFVVGGVLGISYFFGASFYASLLVVSVLGLLGEVVHMPENLPGAYDNAEGEEPHPAKTITLASLVFLVLVAIGHLFLELYNYGFSRSS